MADRISYTMSRTTVSKRYARLVPAFRYVVCDVFTDKPLEGNQLAVFTDGRGIDDETMQKLAKEMNFSETVFVLPPEDGQHKNDRSYQRKEDGRDGQ